MAAWWLLAGPVADTRLNILLRSALVTWPKCWRMRWNRRGFFNSGGPNGHKSCDLWCGMKTPPPLPTQSRFPWPLRVLIAFFALPILALVLFYPVENWRGKRAWEKCQRELSA